MSIKVCFMRNYANIFVETAEWKHMMKKILFLLVFAGIVAFTQAGECG